MSVRLPPGATHGLVGKAAAVFYNRDGTWRPSRYKVLYGGRGSGKSVTVARILLQRMRERKERILCGRELQNSIEDSVHKDLSDEIDALGWLNEFDIQQKRILHLRTGSEAIFKGVRHNVKEIKSTRGVTIFWGEEAQAFTRDSLRIIDPTIRMPGSELWFTFNPELAEDPVWQDFVVEKPENCISAEVNYTDNPYFGETALEQVRLKSLHRDPEEYDWIWEGKIRKRAHAVVFRNRVETGDKGDPSHRWIFSEPTDARPHIGLDFGYADDPAACVRCFVYADPSSEQPEAESLFVTHEAFGQHIELDDLAVMVLGGTVSHGHEPETRSRTYPGVPDVAKWPVKCDASQPAMISGLRRGMGGRPMLNATAADKWPGSIEDGIAHLKAYRRIIVHPRCVNMLREFRMYSYKVDKNDEVLPVILDKNNHGIDALRYSLDGVIQRAGVGKWVKMAGGGR